MADKDDISQDDLESSSVPPSSQPSLPDLGEDPEAIEEVRRLLRENPAEDPEIILQKITRVMAEYTSGPLPPPSMLRGYEEVLPGAADRIFTLMEQQSIHRHDLETKMLDSDVRSRDRGQVFAFVLCFIVIVGGFVAILAGQELTGMAAILTAVAGVAATFLVTRRRQQRQLEEKREVVPEDQEE